MIDNDDYDGDVDNGKDKTRNLSRMQFGKDDNIKNHGVHSTRLSRNCKASVYS